MSTVVDASPVWDIEGETESAITALFAGVVKSWSTQDKQPFQKARGRVEVLVRKGGGLGHFAPNEKTGLEMDVEDAWSIFITLDLLTESDAASHSRLRALVRSVAARLPALLNGNGLKYHELFGVITSVGDTPRLAPDKNTFRTTLQYAAKIGVHSSAWTAMAGT